MNNIILVTEKSGFFAKVEKCIVYEVVIDEFDGQTSPGGYFLYEDTAKLECEKVCERIGTQCRIIKEEVWVATSETNGILPGNKTSFILGSVLNTNMCTDEIRNRALAKLTGEERKVLGGVKMKVYKIRDKNTGLFSTGGVSPKWTKTGKTWSCEGHLKSHLTLLKEYAKYQYDIRYNYGSKRTWKCPPDWEVIVFTYEQQSSECFPASDVADRPAKK